VTCPGTLFLLNNGKDVVMLVKTEKLSDLKIHFKRQKYKHTFLLDDGTLETIETETKSIEHDSFWKEHLVRVL
jgi:hypothetical protein